MKRLWSAMHWWLYRLLMRKAWVKVDILHDAVWVQEPGDEYASCYQLSKVWPVFL